jgi:hypothetical protein
MSENKELEILRAAVDESEKRMGERIVQSPDVQKIIAIVESFLRKRQLVCYGGTAINNILPETEQFYNKDIEIPDYDFFSPDAVNHAKALADMYHRAGYSDVEAKSGVHHGTYKVYVNYIAVADITYLVPELFKAISKESKLIHGIKYAPPNYLRMAMYLELSRPDGDVSRWEKVLKRLTLLNKFYPMRNPRCETIQFQRDFEAKMDWERKLERQEIYYHLRDFLIERNVVFFGGYASLLYGRHMPHERRRRLKQIPDFDVLSENAEETAKYVHQRLIDNGYPNVITKKDSIGEIVPVHYMISANNQPVCFIYEPIACHSYNTITISKKEVRVATIDTMLSFYLAFIYVNRPYYDADRLLCMAQYLLHVQSKNRFSQKGVLKRFSIDCYGSQQTLEQIRASKNKKYNELKGQRKSKEFEEYFLRYIPGKTRTATQSKSRVKQGKSRAKQGKRKATQGKATQGKCKATQGKATQGKRKATQGKATQGKRKATQGKATQGKRRATQGKRRATQGKRKL